MNTISESDKVYLPFWVLLDYIRSPEIPFVECKVLRVYSTVMFKNMEALEVECCDLALQDGQIATAIPSEYLISPSEINDWAKKIADWFLSYKQG